ncbi:hypothetical protein CRG98_038001 [Punica granatum]|uniref:Uncharacterized protein n=1 Tax=Punica granatum TaxID=22663 RepID=A0A2I0IC81_PUNGR|nr:hypothetical protein CRG98_038001 [Punica granatum]
MGMEDVYLSLTGTTLEKSGNPGYPEGHISSHEEEEMDAGFPLGEKLLWCNTLMKRWLRLKEKAG